MSDVVSRRASAGRLVALVASVLATAVSVYLTIEHYSHNSLLACPENSAINCAKVTTSSWSVIFGVPVAVGGLAFFIVMTVLLALPSRSRVLVRARLLGAVVGILSVFFLVGVELFSVNAICLWCTAVHVLTLVVLAGVLWDSLAAPS